MEPNSSEQDRSEAITLLTSSRPRNLSWLGSAGLLFGDWGTSRLYVLGLAFVIAGRSSFFLIAAMSLLILAVGWAYTQICRIYPNGGGVYTAARHVHPLLGVVGALLLFADYTVTASLSSLEAFEYFNVSGKGHVEQVVATPEDAGSDIRIYRERVQHKEWRGFGTEFGAWVSELPGIVNFRSAAFWAIVAILAIGVLNFLGPKHSSGPAILAAGGMIAITMLVVLFALPQIEWSKLDLGQLWHPKLKMWEAFVAIVLALSGVEAIANLTGVMKQPVYSTAKRAIWIVAIEVAVFNLILAVIMCSVTPMSREEHKADMLAFLAGHFVGPWGEWTVRILGGLLLLSATNTAVGALCSTMYVMSRDRELPRFLQKLNGFGAPWIATIVAALVPAFVLLMVHELEQLAHLYAIGIVGAVAINCMLTGFHPRLRKAFRKVPMVALGLLLIAIWITLAITKMHALLFVSTIIAVGFGARFLTRLATKRMAKPSLLRQAIMDQLPPEALARRRIMLATAGSDTLADVAMEIARREESALVVSFIREVALSYRVEAESQLTLETDPAAQALFTDFLAHGQRWGVPIIPAYDSGTNGAELIAEMTAMNGCHKVLIGSSRRGAIHRAIKGSFQKKLESLLPPEIPVQVISLPEVRPEPQPPPTPPPAAGH